MGLCPGSPLDSHQGLCPWTLLWGPPFRLMVCPLWQILDPLLYLSNSFIHITYCTYTEELLVIIT